MAGDGLELRALLLALAQVVLGRRQVVVLPTHVVNAADRWPVPQRAVKSLPRSRTLIAAPLAVADLHDHQTAANADNMHDLCLGQLPPGARLRGIRIDAGLIQDPNGDHNAVERLRLRPNEMPSAQASSTP